MEQHLAKETAARIAAEDAAKEAAEVRNPVECDPDPNLNPHCYGQARKMAEERRTCAEDEATTPAPRGDSA